MKLFARSALAARVWPAMARPTKYRTNGAQEAPIIIRNGACWLIR